jgi:hypothetical protein
MSVVINTSSDNNRFTSLDDSRKSQKEKKYPDSFGHV